MNVSVRRTCPQITKIKKINAFVIIKIYKMLGEEKKDKVGGMRK
jgi:hypothetical protein